MRYLGERQVIQAVDPRFAEVLAHLEKLSDGDVAALSSDESGQRWIVSFTHDREPGIHVLLRPRDGREQVAVPAVPALGSRGAGADDAVTIPSRDGLDLHGI